jgi:hypothetical protein
MGAYEVIDSLDGILDLPDYLNYDPIKENQLRNGVVVPDKFWVINPQTDAVIGDGKGQHHPSNFNIMWDSLKQGLMNSDLDLSNARTTFWGYKNNSSMRAEITLPNMDFTPQLGEASCMKINAIDSHNQSFKRSIEAFILRLECLNGMVGIAENTSLAEKHTKNAMPHLLGAVASAWPKLLMDDAERMAYLRSVRVTDEQAVEFYSESLATRKTRTGSEINKQRLNYIMMIHDQYKLGNNAYRVYNTLTHLSTHIDVQRKGSCQLTKQLRMENEIKTVVHSDSFRELAQLNDFAIAA